MKKILVILLLILLLTIAGLLWKENQLQSQLLSERIEEQKQEIPKIPDPQGLTTDEQVRNWNSNLVTFRQTAEASGFSDEEISMEIERKINEWTPKLKKLSESEKESLMCQYSKKWVLNDAASQGMTRLEELEELSKIYDLLCEE